MGILFQMGLHHSKNMNMLRNSTNGVKPSIQMHHLRKNSGEFQSNLIAVNIAICQVLSVVHSSTIYELHHEYL
jgi:hypothetical protein